jgi:hypothetical protein
MPNETKDTRVNDESHSLAFRQNGTGLVKPNVAPLQRVPPGRPAPVQALVAYGPYGKHALQDQVVPVDPQYPWLELSR